MAPLVLEGATLGKRHQHYNKLLKDVTSSKVQPDKIDYNKTDIENLLNIDVASNNRDLEYIFDVLKGDDMLYVSRAIKQSTWLITDAQYAHIIDPEYLHSQLFPQMMPKASSKLLLHVRLILKDESRVEKFFLFFKEKDFKTATKWLPNCSISFIGDVVEKHAEQITPNIFGRLCRRSPKILEIYVKATEGNYYRAERLKAAMFLLNSYADLYLDTLDNEKCNIPNLTKKHTEIVMKKYPHRIINNFEKYCYSVHLETFAKCLKKENIKNFILTQRENKNMKYWFNQDTMDIFIKYMPKEEKTEFIKQCVDRATKDDDECVVPQYELKCRTGGRGGTSNSSIYNWYKHAPFEVAFPELKKLIRAESNPDERNTMLMILVGNAKKKQTHIHTLLQYYRERHINEPFRFKVQFVNDLLQKTDPHLYNDENWSILDELFRSMEVYIESENNVQTCIKAIIAYKVMHDEAVHVMIEQKFEYDFLKPYERKLKGAQRDKLFTYLYHLFLNKLNDHVITYPTEFGEYIEFLKKGLDLLNVWKKDLVNYPFLISKIKECVKIKKEKKWTTSLAPLYDTKTSWKKILFDDSLVLSPSEIVCMNSLKHGPELLVRHQDEVDSLRYNDAIPMQKVLRKLRIYWPESIASNWTAAYRERLDRPGGHKALVRGLCCLLNQHELLKFFKKYEPQEAKINWVDVDELQLSLRKNIAQTMHIARPQVSPDAILWYAKGDYVQFTQPALNSILYNLRPSHSRDCILKLMNGMVSLQKHSIDLALAKLSTADMKQLFEDVWKNTKNSSIRAVLFQNTNDMMCKEQDELLIAEAWELLQTFIDSLTAEESNAIYNTFGKLAKVPYSIKPAYCLKSYKFLKSLPSKVDCKDVLEKVTEEMCNITEKLDSDFIASIIEEFTNEVILKKICEYTTLSDRHGVKILTSYLLSAETENDQTARFNKVFVPLMEKSLLSWDKTDEYTYFIVKQNFIKIIEILITSTDYSFLQNKANPINLYRHILKKLESTLPATQNLFLFQLLKLAAAIVDMLDMKRSDSISITEKSQLHDLYSTCASDMSSIIVKYLKEDVDEYGSFVYRQFAKAANKIFELMNINDSTKMKCIRHMLSEKDFLPIYLLSIKMVPSYLYYCNTQLHHIQLKEIHELIKSHPSSEVQINYSLRFADRLLGGK